MVAFTLLDVQLFASRPEKMESSRRNGEVRQASFPTCRGLLRLQRAAGASRGTLRLDKARRQQADIITKTEASTQ